MGSFTLVVTGNPTNAADLNQMVNALNGTVGTTMLLLSTNNATTPLAAYLPSTPSSDIVTVGAVVVGDASYRAALYLRSDGYGGLSLGSGTAIKGHLYAVASGLQITESLVIGTNLGVSGTSTLGPTSVTTLTSSGAVTFSGGNLNVNSDIVSTGNIVCGASSAIFLGNLMICQAYFAVRKTDGTKLFECRANGDFTISGVTLRTAAGSSSGYGTGGVFDSFDVAETYPTEERYPAGMVLAPSDEVYAPCTVDASPFAVVVSLGGGVQLGPNEEDNNEIAVPIALTGRVRVDTDEDIQPRQWVTATNDGKVRAIRPGETAYTLGYVLHPTHRGQVGIFLRQGMMTVPKPKPIRKKTTPC